MAQAGGWSRAAWVQKRGVEFYGEVLAELADYVGMTAPGTAIDIAAVIRTARHPRKVSSADVSRGVGTRVGLMLSCILPERVFGALLRRRMR